jgi:hypothetical protein
MKINQVSLALGMPVDHLLTLAVISIRRHSILLTFIPYLHTLPKSRQDEREKIDAAITPKTEKMILCFMPVLFFLYIATLKG